MKTKKLALLILTGLACAGAARGGVFHCGTAQDLQTALSLAAANGEDDTIYLAAGIYYGNFTFNSSEAQSLTILSETNTLPGQVVLDGQRAGATLTVNAGSAIANVNCQGVTFRNGYGGLFVQTAGVINVQKCSMVNNGFVYYVSTVGEGGFYFSGASSVTLTGDNISGNASYPAGGGTITSALISTPRQSSFLETKCKTTKTLQPFTSAQTQRMFQTTHL
jgi:hypothetical protein